MVWATCVLLMALSLLQHFEVSPRQKLRNMVLVGKQFFTLDNYLKHTALDTRYWLLCNTPHWMQTPLQTPDQIENLWHNLEEVRNHMISSKNDLKKPLEEEWMKITR